MTKSDNSCKTCSSAKSHYYIHHMLVTVCEYEQNPSRGVGGVVHTRFRVVRTYIQTDKRMDGEVQILIPTHNFVGGINICMTEKMQTTNTH